MSEFKRMIAVEKPHITKEYEDWGKLQSSTTNPKRAACARSFHKTYGKQTEDSKVWGYWCPTCKAYWTAAVPHK